MEDMGVKAVVIGVSIFVTLVVLSLVFLSFNQMTEIFALVQDTDNSIHKEFENYVDKYKATYDDKTLTGVDLLNALKKAEAEEGIEVEVTYNGYLNVRTKASQNSQREVQYLKYLMEGNKKLNGIKYTYQDKYSVTVEEQENKIVIRFSK